MDSRNRLPLRNRAVSKKTSKKRIERTDIVYVPSGILMLFQRKPQKRGLKVSSSFIPLISILSVVSKKTSKKRIERDAYGEDSVNIVASVSKKTSKKRIESFDSLGYFLDVS